MNLKAKIKRLPDTLLQSIHHLAGAKRSLLDNAKNGIAAVCESGGDATLAVTHTVSVTIRGCIFN
jgi:hypothetical protein